jgi:hypothetical protein
MKNNHRPNIHSFYAPGRVPMLCGAILPVAILTLLFNESRGGFIPWGVALGIVFIAAGNFTMLTVAALKLLLIPARRLRRISPMTERERELPAGFTVTDLSRADPCEVPLKYERYWCLKPRDRYLYAFFFAAMLAMILISLIMLGLPLPDLERWAQDQIKAP